MQNEAKKSPAIRVIVALIELYQKTLSPDHGWFSALHPNGFCKFHPTCSEYAKQSLETHGIAGILPSAARILRCNPFSSGGLDPIK